MSSENKTAPGAIEVLAWLDANKKAVGIGLVLILALLFGTWIFRYYSNQQEQAASTALVNLETGEDQAERQSPSASAYLAIVEEYPGTTAADRALYLAAGAYYTEAEYAQARQLFERVLSEQPTQPWTPMAAIGLASTLEAQGNLEEALNAYQNAAVRFPKSSIVTEAKLAMARIHEAQDRPEAALKIYEELGSASPPTMATAQANMKKDKLLSQHPELKPAPAAEEETLNPPEAPTTEAAEGAANQIQPADAPATSEPVDPAPEVPEQPAQQPSEAPGQGPNA